MKTFTVEATLDCLGVYSVVADTEEEAIERWEQWDGSDEFVSFSHYSEVDTDEIRRVTED